MVIVGSALVLLSLGNGDDERIPPRVGDHWHAAYGVYDCTTLVAPFPDSMARSDSGIHTHNDGLIHLEVNSSRYSGLNANVGAFADGVDLQVTESKLEGPGVSRKEGDRCGENRGIVQLAVWDDAGDESPTVVTDDLAAFAPKDGQLVTLAFAPADSPIPKPPDAAVRQLGGQAGGPTTSPAAPAGDARPTSSSPAGPTDSSPGSTSP